MRVSCSGRKCGIKTHLVAEGVSADDDGVHPSWDGLRDFRKDDRLAEYGTAEDVTYRPVRTPPHFLQVELLDTGLVRGNGSTFDSNLVFENGVGSVNGDLVVGLRRLRL